ncbi:hypothetical protein VTO42DRAFT_5595 [Malbranchea cinnamomea]
MPLKSRWSIDIPDASLPTVVFQSPTHPLSTTRRSFSDATRPETHYFTTHDYRLWCLRFAAGLRKSGLRPGDRVMMFSPNDLFYPVAFMGIVMAGGVFTGANPTYTPRELAYQLKDSGATYLLCADAVIDTGIAAAKSIGMSLDRVFVFNSALYDGKGNGLKGTRYWGELVASKEEGSRFSWDPLTGPGQAKDRLLALNYSSGTTGVPKGVEITHRNYVANLLQFNHLATLDPEYEQKRRSARFLCFLPMYHAMAQNIFISSALVREIPVYIMARFDFIQMLEHIQKFRITDLILVPPIAIALTKHPAVKNYDLSSIRYLGSGAAPLGMEVTQELEKMFSHKFHVRQGWGMTETTLSLLGWDPNMKGTSISVGELNANCEAKIMAEDEVTELGRNQRGEIWVRAPNIMRGYWGKPEATRDTLTPDGWLKTGDIGYVDDSGMFFIVDRKKELIKVKGNQVAPAELESLLLDHPAVADAAVIGVAKDGDEYPRAYITLKPGKTATEADIVNYMKDKVAPTKRITGGVVFIDAIPRNPSGKILRKVLRDRAAQELKQGVTAKL